MNKEWVETARRLMDECAERAGDSKMSANYNKADFEETNAKYRRAKVALEAHLNTPNTDQVDSAKATFTAPIDGKQTQLVETERWEGTCRNCGFVYTVSKVSPKIQDEVVE